MAGNLCNLIIFASGSGTNAENIINFQAASGTYRVAAVMSDRRDAFVLERVRRSGTPSVTFSAAELAGNILHTGNGDTSFLSYLESMHADYIILAGFLRKIPEYMIERYPGRILNIHPALLPAYGGKGMYGEHVHKAVIAAGEKESGITIHLADNLYDHGRIIYQARCPVSADDTPESLAAKIHGLEKAYPEVIAEYIRSDQGRR